MQTDDHIKGIPSDQDLGYKEIMHTWNLLIFLHLHLSLSLGAHISHHLLSWFLTSPSGLAAPHLKFGAWVTGVAWHPGALLATLLTHVVCGDVSS